MASCGWLPNWDSTAITPGPRTAPPLTGRAAFYVRIEGGQSVADIARLYRVPKRDIIAANHLGAPYSLKPGTLLEVPLNAVGAIGKAKKSPAKAVATRAVRKHIKLAKTIKPVRHAKARHPAAIPPDPLFLVPAQRAVMVSAPPAQPRLPRVPAAVGTRHEIDRFSD